MKLNTLELPNHPEASLDARLEELPEHVEVEEIQQGLKTWINPINGFRVLRLHYSADPAKRTPEWRFNEKRKYGESEWNREMELVWESLEGRAIYADHWSPEFHISKTQLGWNPKYPVCRGWDFGLNAACVFSQLFPHSRLFILREAVSEDISFETFLQEVSRLSLEWFPGASFIEFIDPTGRYRMGADERSYAMMLASKPLNCRRIISGVNEPAGRIKSVIDFLKENVKGQASYIVDSSCETLIKGFNGGYLYGFDSRNRIKDKPEKNFFSHVHDANQYLCSKVKSSKLELRPGVGKIQEPGYGKERSAYVNV